MWLVLSATRAHEHTLVELLLPALVHKNKASWDAGSDKMGCEHFLAEFDVILAKWIFGQKPSCGVIHHGCLPPTRRFANGFCEIDFLHPFIQQRHTNFNKNLSCGPCAFLFLCVHELAHSLQAWVSHVWQLPKIEIVAVSSLLHQLAGNTGHA